jgi:hypothetical protein
MAELAAMKKDLGSKDPESLQPLPAKPVEVPKEKEASASFAAFVLIVWMLK